MVRSGLLRPYVLLSHILVSGDIFKRAREFCQSQSFRSKNSSPSLRMCEMWAMPRSRVDSRIPKIQSQSYSIITPWTQVPVPSAFLGMYLLIITVKFKICCVTACFPQCLHTQEWCCMSINSFRDSLSFTLQSSNLLLLLWWPRKIILELLASCRHGTELIHLFCANVMWRC